MRSGGGEGAEAAVSAPRAVVGLQVDGGTADSVTVESDMPLGGNRFGRPGPVWTRPRSRLTPRALGQTNVVFADIGGSMTAASDPRSDGAAVVAHYPDRLRR